MPGDFFTATGPFAELNKKDTYVEMSQNDLAELDKEVERISKKSPKDTEGGSANEPEESEEPLNTRNFNTLPRNYSDSLELKKEKEAEEQKTREAQQFGRTSEFSRSEEHFTRLLRKSVVKIVIEGVSANSMQSAQNLIPYLNFASLLRRRDMDEEALEIEMLAGLSLLSSRRYVQAAESFRRIQTKILERMMATAETSVSASNRKAEAPQITNNPGAQFFARSDLPLS